jgi:hypothetical protein
MHSVLFLRDNSTAALHAYSRAATWKLPGCMQWQVLKQHVCARRCPAVAAVSQNTYQHSAVTCSGRIPNCMRGAALLQWQVLKLLN